MNDIQTSHLDKATLNLLRASNTMNSTLLITGSTGTGKSHIAQLVHSSCKSRSGAKFSKVNLATLSENLMESELFGHEKGAFTGADSRRAGRLELCNGGTVFLDEIGELSLRLQTKLLDFIQYKKITPVGSNREMELDVRIVVATNRDLEAMVKSGEFRSDLFHRLNVFHVRLPDMSERPQNIMTFARKFLHTRARSCGKLITGFSGEVERVMTEYSWPGNIRELENVIEYAVALEDTALIRLSSLPASLIKRIDAIDISPESTSTSMGLKKVAEELSLKAISYFEFPLTMDFHECKDAFEKTYIEELLKLCRGQINLTSRTVGLNKVSLREKIKKFNIDWKKIRQETIETSSSSKYFPEQPELKFLSCNTENDHREADRV